MRGKVEVINDVIHERKVLEKAALDRMRKQLYGVWTNGYAHGKEDAEAYALHCGDETPATNADRIRSMTDEELADWIWGAESAGRAYGPRGKNAWLDWLRKEAE